MNTQDNFESYVVWFWSSEAFNWKFRANLLRGISIGFAIAEQEDAYLDASFLCDICWRHYHGEHATHSID